MALQVDPNLLAANRAPLTAKECRLLSLPTEIRLMIYSYLFSPDAWCNSDPQEWAPEYTASGLARLRIARNERHGYHLGAYDIIELNARFFLPGLALLQTCKQLYLEGMPIMFGAFQIDVPVGAMYFFEDWITSIGEQARTLILSIHAAVVVDLSPSSFNELPGLAVTSLANLLPLPRLLIITLLLDNPTSDGTRTQKEHAAEIDGAIFASQGVTGYRNLGALLTLKRRGVRFRIKKRRVPEQLAVETWAPNPVRRIVYDWEMLSEMVRLRAWFAVHFG